MAAGAVKHWLNIPAPGGRNRKIDLFIGEPGADGKADMSKVRVCVENKSVITAHRNRDARFDDLDETMKAVHNIRSEAVIVATVMIGTALRTLNIPDDVKAFYVKQGKHKEFSALVEPRLSSGDQALWSDFPAAISDNRPADPAKTLAKLRTLKTRNPGFTHVQGYDFIMFAPMFINNVDPPHVDRQNSLGLNVDEDYTDFLDAVCKAYRVRWHP